MKITFDFSVKRFYAKLHISPLYFLLVPECRMYRGITKKFVFAWLIFSFEYKENL